VAAVETGSSSRSLGAAASIETLIRRDYLAPDAADIAGTVERLYSEPARIYGVPYERYSLVRLKQSWFAAYRAWELTLEADTLRVSEDAAGRAFASFDMRYDYTPKDEAQARQRGRARVHLELASTPHGWRIVSETSEALP
jgi:hypothetical protein